MQLGIKGSLENARRDLRNAFRVSLCIVVVDFSFVCVCDRFDVRVCWGGELREREGEKGEK